MKNRVYFYAEGIVVANLRLERVPLMGETFCHNETTYKIVDVCTNISDIDDNLPRIEVYGVIHNWYEVTQ